MRCNSELEAVSCKQKEGRYLFLTAIGATLLLPRFFFSSKTRASVEVPCHLVSSCTTKGRKCVKLFWQDGQCLDNEAQFVDGEDSTTCFKNSVAMPSCQVVSSNMCQISGILSPFKRFLMPNVPRIAVSSSTKINR